MTTVLELEPVPCPLCGATDPVVLARLRDVALGAPGDFALARCRSCGLLHQNPRVRAEDLGRAYERYPAHARDAGMPGILRTAGPAVRWTLATALGYAHVDARDVTAGDRVMARLRRRKILASFPPWTGRGRLLDVGCATGKFLSLMAAVGWRVAGVEIDAEAAATAKQVTPDIFVGDPVQAPFRAETFDVITAFHSLEHVPQPREALAAMLRWLAPGGLVIVEVPNAAGLGARLFGRYWCGFDFPRHLVHFTPETMTAMVERAGGRVVAAGHRTKPRYVTRSLRHWLRDQPGAVPRLALAALDSRAGAGAAKLLLEALMPLGRRLGYGEAVRYHIRRRDKEVRS